MAIPLLSNVFSTPGHILEESHFSGICTRCHRTCQMGEIQSVQNEGTRIYHCLGCSAVVASVSDPGQVDSGLESYLIGGWAVRPLTSLSIALEVSAITVAPVRAQGNITRQAVQTISRKAA